MRLKSFYAKTMSEAMQIVRDTLGEDAIIVATREENGGKSVRVTAAVEQRDDSTYNDPHFELGQGEKQTSSAGVGAEENEILYSNKPMEPSEEASPKLSNTNWLQYDDEEDEEGYVIEYLTDTMLQHSVPGDVLDNIVSTAAMVGHDEPLNTLNATFEHLYNFHPLPQKPTRKALMLVGPPGAGKTLATAKIAARFVMEGYKVGVVTTDTVRAGGVEQLSSLAKLMKCELRRAKTPQDLKAHLQELDDKVDQIIIDTGGSNPHDVDDMRDLAALINVSAIDPVLVIQSGLDADESSEIARSYALLGIQRMLPTRLDISRRFGGLLSAAQKSGMAFTDASDTPKVANGLTVLNPDMLSKLFLPSYPDAHKRHALEKRLDDDQNGR